MNAFRLFSTDLEGTLLGRPEAVDRFIQAWASIPRGVRPLLVYNTGKSVRETRDLVAAKRLPEPDFVFGGLGTELFAALYDVEPEFRTQFATEWDFDRVEAIVGSLAAVRSQGRENTNRWKSSWYWEHARRHDLILLESRFKTEGLRARVEYSCRHFLDVVPNWAGKGQALAWLCRRLGIALHDVVVAGDSAQDISMYRLPGVRAILLANALPELRSELQGVCTVASSLELADGIVDVFSQMGLLPRSNALKPSAATA